MAAPVFAFINERDSQTASVLIPGRERPFPAYPLLCFSSAGAALAEAAKPVAPGDGVVARLIDPQHLGTVVTCRGESFTRPQANGRPGAFVEVELPNHTQRVVPLANLEILKRS
jgi:hypothetical protein